MLDWVFKKIEKIYHRVSATHFKILFPIFILIPLGLVLVSGWILNLRVRNIAIENFNQQQLILAKYAAFQIENRLEILKRELTLLSLSSLIQYVEYPALIRRMENTLMSVKHEGVKEIEFIEAKKGKKYVVYEIGKARIENKISEKEKGFLKWAANRENFGKILYDEIEITTEKGEKKLIKRMVIPVYQVSIDEAHPVATNEFSGVLIFRVDVGYLVKRIAENITSGKTGYAWVIDDKGRFLYHVEKSFIGESAFEIRQKIAPILSFEKINIIQKEKMLKGEEGTDWYISGWHREKKGFIKKLIAYAPIKVSESDNNSIIWSIAVVAPIDEVEGTIKSIQIQQIIFHGIIILVILLGGMLIIVFLMKWSELLEKEVIKKTEELRRSEEKYRSLIENAEDIIFTVNKEGKIISINKVASRIFGCNEEELINKNVIQLFQPDGERLMKLINFIFEIGETIEINNKLVIPNNEYWFSTKLSPLKDEQGNIYAVLGISRDITEKRKMEEQIYYTEKLAALGTLAAGIAHEINNPLTIILGFSDLLKERFPPNSKEYEIFKIIEKQSLKAKGIVENLLTFARPKKSKEELININQCLETVLSIIGNTLFLNNIKVVKNFEENIPPVLGNPEELEQVFFNIINNAKDAMKNGGILTITTKRVNSWVEVSISDTGCGIKPEYREKIFDPFFTTKEPGKGTGLGLYVSYAIIKKHNGLITFETKTEEENKDSGTTFYIRLPVYNKK